VKRERDQLIDVLVAARDLLKRPDNDFSWSSWRDSADAVREIDRLILRIRADDIPKRIDIDVLFAPTGPIQEVSLSSGWAGDFLTLADQFDKAANRCYGWRRWLPW
jgi:hypothetical protein